MDRADRAAHGGTARGVDQPAARQGPREPAAREVPGPAGGPARRRDGRPRRPRAQGRRPRPPRRLHVLGPLAAVRPRAPRARLPPRRLRRRQGRAEGPRRAAQAGRRARGREAPAELQPRPRPGRPPPPRAQAGHPQPHQARPHDQGRHHRPHRAHLAVQVALPAHLGQEDAEDPAPDRRQDRLRRAGPAALLAQEDRTRHPQGPAHRPGRGHRRPRHGPGRQARPEQVDRPEERGRRHTGQPGRDSPRRPARRPAHRAQERQEEAGQGPDRDLHRPGLVREGRALVHPRVPRARKGQHAETSHHKFHFPSQGGGHTHAHLRRDPEEARQSQALGRSARPPCHSAATVLPVVM